MQKLSSSKYYRYKIRDLTDLSAAVHERRGIKIDHQRANRVLLDWTECDQFSLAAFKTMTSVHPDWEHFLSWRQMEQNHGFFSEFICQQNLILFHIQINNAHEFLKLNNFSKTTKLKQSAIELAMLVVHFSPRTKTDLNSFKENLANLIPLENYGFYFWDFRTFVPTLKGSLTISDIHQFLKTSVASHLTQMFTHGNLKGLEIWNHQIAHQLEMESLAAPIWKFSTPRKSLKLSIVIPSFNNSQFLTNVVHHLSRQVENPEHYEIIIVEDGGTDQTSEVLKTLFKNRSQTMNLKFIYWNKTHPERGPQNFFRAGLARNLGARFAEADNLIFLDSDILVPPDFVTTCLNELKTHDLIQFQRFHVQQNLSLTNPVWKDVKIEKDTYIEERNYWNQLFTTENWMLLPQYWKFTCTYALGLKKTDFYDCGRFKKYYTSYGFEDTDLGYELHKKNKTFKLVKMPLLHLTAYNHMQYKNSQSKRIQLLKKTAALFFLQHLDPEIYETLGNFFRFERSLLQSLKNRL